MFHHSPHVISLLICTLLLTETLLVNGQCRGSETTLPVDTLRDSGMRSQRLDNTVDGPRLWNSARIPFTVDSRFTRTQREQIQDTLNEFHSQTCVRFVPNEGCRESSYVFMSSGTPFTFQIGKSGARQQAGLAPKNVERKQEATHQLMHVLGFVHEEQRRDAQKHLTGDFIHCGVGMRQERRKYPNDLGDFDYDSVTSRLGYSRGGCDAVKAKDAFTGVINQENTRRMFKKRTGPSRLDIEKINKAYGCV